MRRLGAAFQRGGTDNASRKWSYSQHSFLNPAQHESADKAAHSKKLVQIFQRAVADLTNSLGILYALFGIAPIVRQQPLTDW